MPYATLARHTKPNGIQCLQVIDFVDEPDWQEGAQIDWLTNAFSDHHRHIYIVVEVSVDHVPYLREMVRQYDNVEDAEGNEIEGSNYAPRTGAMFGGSIDDFCSAVGITRERFLSSESLPIIDCTGMSIGVWTLDNLNCTFEYVTDTAAWTAGTASIQAGGSGDYLTGAAYSADIGWGSLTGDIAGSYDSAITETASVDFDGDNQTYNTTLTSGSDHLGNPLAGNLIGINHNDIGIQCRIDGAGGFFCIEKLYLKNIGGSTNSIISVVGMTNAHDVKITRCLFDQNGVGETVLNINDADATMHIYLNKIWSWDDNGEYGISLTNHAGAASVIENNTLYLAGAVGNPRGIIANNLGGTYRNNLIVIDDNFSFVAVGSATGYNNYSSGDTGEDADFSVGSSNIASGTTAVFVSVDDTSADFLKPVASSAIDGTATSPTLWSFDIAGNPYNGTIGAQQIVAAGNPYYYFRNQ